MNAPELRKDPVVGRWVVISPERARRPNPFRHFPARMANAEASPFLAGREAMTPPEVLAYRPHGGPANGPGWTVRVVPNKFPALRIEGEVGGHFDGIYDILGGVGAHEVLIESPDPERDLKDLDLVHVAQVVEAYRDRMVDLYGDRRFRFVLGFKNRGAAAGATIDHPHGQIIALPVIPSRLERELDGAARYHAFRGRCVYCDVIRQELAAGSRVVCQNESFVALTPFASRFPFEVILMPLQHEAFFWTLTQREMTALAEVLRDVLRRYALTLRDPAYNFMIHTAPPQHAHPDQYHWHIELMPRLLEVAGFEWGTGLFINPVPPEDAASQLRNLTEVMNVPDEHLL